MVTPHKHAEVIKAWADGAQIQYYENRTGKWADCTASPSWLEDSLYRVKTEPKVEKTIQKYEVSGDKVLWNKHPNTPRDLTEVEWVITDGVITDVKLVK